jgi:hypothetical protein
MSRSVCSRIAKLMGALEIRTKGTCSFAGYYKDFTLKKPHPGGLCLLLQIKTTASIFPRFK